MSDTPNPVLAGTESAPVQPEAVETRTPEERLAAWSGDDEPTADTLAGDEAGDPAEAEAQDAGDEGQEPEAGAEGEEEPGEPGADEEPAGDAAEPAADTGDDETIHGNKYVVLRDNSKVRVGELKQSHEELRELKQRVLPQVQQRLQSFEQERQQFAAQQQQFQPVIAQVAQILQNQLPPAATDELWRDDPIEAAIQDRTHAKAVQQLQAVNHARAQAEAQAKQQHEQQLQQFAHQAVAKFVDAQPELRDPVKGKAFYDDYQAVAAHVGFTPQEAARVLDPRLYRLAQLAAIGMKSMQQGTQQTAVKAQQKQIADKKVQNAPPVSTPAARQNAGTRNTTVLRAAREKLRKTGSVQDGIAALNSLDF